MQKSNVRDQGHPFRSNFFAFLKEVELVKSEGIKLDFVEVVSFYLPNSNNIFTMKATSLFRFLKMPGVFVISL